jgi:DNA-binding transcriptional LysR family regulator
LSRNVQELEDEIGVDLLRRGPRGVSLTAEGKLFLEEARELLKRADESVERVRALARGVIFQGVFKSSAFRYAILVVAASIICGFHYLPLLGAPPTPVCD